MKDDDYRPAEPAPEDSGPAKRPRRTLGARLRGYLLAGILITAPFAITFYIAWEFIGLVDQNVIGLLPNEWQPDRYLRFGLPGVGLIVVILFLMLVGWLAAGYVGRVALRIGEKAMQRMPVMRSIYNAAKQILESVMGNQSRAFRQVVLVEFPRKDIWTIAFITGEPIKGLRRHLPEESVGVMVPTSPNPTSGYFLFVKKSDLVFLDISVEEGMKQVISMGMATASKDSLDLALGPAAGTETAQPERSSRTP